MKLIEIIATAEQLNIKNNTLTYLSEQESDAGILLNYDKTGEKDMIIINQIHTGGKVSIQMKPIRTPARKYAVGDVVAVLMVDSGQE